MQGAIDMANEPISVNPAIQGHFGNVENQIRNSYNDPFGAASTPAVREKSLRSNLMQLGAEKGKALNEGYFDGRGQKFGEKMTVAGMTAPQLTTTGGTTNGTTTQQQTGGFWRDFGTSMLSGAMAF